MKQQSVNQRSNVKSARYIYIFLNMKCLPFVSEHLGSKRFVFCFVLFFFFFFFGEVRGAHPFSSLCCGVFLYPFCDLYPMLPMSLGCPLLITTSGFL